MPMVEASDPRDASVYRLLFRMICALVDYPSEVTIQTEASNDGATFIIRAHPEDVGKIIGAQGRNARSLRTLVSAIGRKQQCRFNVVIDEGATGNRSSSQGTGVISRTEEFIPGLRVMLDNHKRDAQLNMAEAGQPEAANKSSQGLRSP
jgi:uncharacterized protein